MGNVGQHKALVDCVLEERKALCEEYDLDEDQVMCWAVCDDDNMPYPYSELAEYAHERGVQLAFSRPQFEAFLLQHFEQASTVDQVELYEKLELHRQQYETGGKFEKGNIDWLEEAIYLNPNLVDVAITNSRQRNRQSKSPFLTVHELVDFLSSLRL